MESSVEEFFYYLMLKHYFCIRSVAVRVNELFDMLPGMHTVSVLFLLVRNLKVSHNSGISRRILWWKMSHLIIRYEAVACDRSASANIWFNTSEIDTRLTLVGLADPVYERAKESCCSGPTPLDI